MSGIFKKGDLVQSVRGGPVMRVVSVSEDATGETVVSTALADGRPVEPGRHHASTLKIVGVIEVDDDKDFDDDFDDRGD